MDVWGVVSGAMGQTHPRVTCTRGLLVTHTSLCCLQTLLVNMLPNAASVHKANPTLGLPVLQHDVGRSLWSPTALYTMSVLSI